MTKNSLWLLLLFALCCGCNDDGTFVPPADLSGVWTLVADSTSPPATVACSGAIAGMANQPLCGAFDLDLDQLGTQVSGTSTQAYCGRDFTAAFVISGNDIAGGISSDNGSTVQHFTVTGAVSGNTAILQVGTFSVEGLSGTCTTDGNYLATR